MASEFIVPKNIITGVDALKQSSKYFERMGKKALIVTDSVMVQLHNVDKVCEVLRVCNVQYTIYDQISGEPTDTMIEAGKEIYEKEGCDFFIAIGGGSPIDAMKAIAATVHGVSDINSYMNKTIDHILPPMVAIPTTAGTGSEATQFTIITNTKENIKMLLKGTSLIPNLAVVDPQFTMSVPAHITAATGLDALCHAIESYTSKKAQTMSQTFSVSAIKKIMEYLPITYDEGSNLAAREQMAIAALEAGIAFNNASVTLIHGMSRPIGALYHVPHGLSNAMLLEVCLEYAIVGQEKVFAQLAKDCGYAEQEITDQEATSQLLNKVKELIQHCHIQTLKDFGVENEDFYHNIPKMAKDAMDSGSPQNTLRTCSLEDVIALYQKLL